MFYAILICSVDRQCNIPSDLIDIKVDSLIRVDGGGVLNLQTGGGGDGSVSGSGNECF